MFGVYFNRRGFSLSPVNLTDKKDLHLLPPLNGSIPSEVEKRSLQALLYARVGLELGRYRANIN